MTFQRSSIARVALFTLVLSGSLAVAADAAAPRGHRVGTKVPTGVTPNDFHATMINTQGDIVVKSVTPLPDSVKVSGGGNTIDVWWGTKLAPGDSVGLDFTSAGGLVSIGSGEWTNDGVVISTTLGTQYISQYSVPGSNPTLMLIIAMALAAAASLALFRRRIQA